MIEGLSHIALIVRDLYFYHDDNHLFELHADIFQERLKRYEAAEQDHAGA